MSNLAATVVTYRLWCGNAKLSSQCSQFVRRWEIRIAHGGISLAYGLAEVVFSAVFSMVFSAADAMLYCQHDCGWIPA